MLRKGSSSGLYVGRRIGAYGRQARRGENEADLLRPLRTCLSRYGRSGRQGVFVRQGDRSLSRALEKIHARAIDSA